MSTQLHHDAAFRIATVVIPSFFTENTEDGPVERSRDHWYIAAEAPNGQRFVHADGPYDTEDEALCVVGVGSPRTKPDAWREMEPAYGSDAWDDEAEYSLACFEADCFGE